MAELDENGLQMSELAGPDLRLNLTDDPWNLPGGYVPVLEGIDVTRRGLRPDGGRRAIYTSPPVALGTITTVYACNIKCSAPVVYRGSIAGSGGALADTFVISRYSGFALVGTGETTLLNWGDVDYSGWSTDLIGSTVIFNGDGRMGDPQYATVDRIVGLTQLITTKPLIDLPANSTFTIYASRLVDYRGLIVSDGRRIYLMRGTTWTLLLDLGSDAYLALRWEITQLDKFRLLLTNPTQIPRVLSSVPPSLDHQPYIESSSYYAGIIPPKRVKPENVAITPADQGFCAYLTLTADPNKVFDKSFNTRIKLRAVNLETGAESEFIDAYNSFHATIASEPLGALNLHHICDDGQTTAADTLQSARFTRYGFLAGDRLLVYGPTSVAGTYDILSQPASNQIKVTPDPGWAVGVTQVYAEVLTGSAGKLRANIRLVSPINDLILPIDQKFSHIEVWRTDAAGGTYYLESRIEIGDDRVDGWYDSTYATGPRGTDCLVNGYGTDHMVTRPMNMLGANLAGQTPLLSADINAGRLPPCCKQSVSISGITVFLGASTLAALEAQVDARAFYMFGAAYTAATKTIARDAGASNSFANYVFKAGDRFEIFSSDSGFLFTSYPIASATADTVVLASGPAGNLANVYGFIRRALAVPWPRIEDDELLYHSRTDKFSPESVVASPVRLSSVGDKFQRAVVVGGFGAAVMRSAAHVLIPGVTKIEVETVGWGIGTPWADSVIVAEDLVFWAGEHGVQAMRISQEADSDGKRGHVATLDKGAMRGWFEAALAAGDDMDAGYDPTHKCLRFRRKPVDGSVGDVLQYSIHADRWVILKGDSGTRYVTSRFAEAADLTSDRLYSVSLANLFEENYLLGNYPYAGKLYAGTIDIAAIVVTTPIAGTNRITRSGAAALFSTAMKGDVIWFTSTATARNRVERVITAVDTTGDCDWIEFAAVTGLAAGDAFVIGPVRTRVRWPAFPGSSPEDSVKTLDGCTLKALPGPRAMSAGSGYAHDAAFTLRSYRGYGTTAEDEVSDVVAWDEDDVAKTEQDRVSAIEGQGKDVQLEVEMIAAAQDWRMVSIRPAVREEGRIGDDDAAS